MSQGTFSDTLIRLEAFKRIFVIRPKSDFFPRGQSRVFWPSLKPGTWNIPEHTGTSRIIPEHENKIIIKKLRY